MRKKETPNPSRVRGRGVEVSETLFYALVLTVKYAECQFEKIRVQYLTDVLYINNAKEIINIMKRRK